MVTRTGEEESDIGPAVQEPGHCREGDVQPLTGLGRVGREENAGRPDPGPEIGREVVEAEPRRDDLR
jgi:hypothetical protein